MEYYINKNIFLKYLKAKENPRIIYFFNTVKDILNIDEMNLDDNNIYLNSTNENQENETKKLEFIKNEGIILENKK